MMAQHTISEAEAALASLSGLSDNQRRQCEAELQAAKAKATATGTAAADQLAQQVRLERDDLLRELCEVRDQLATAAAGCDKRALTDLRQRRQRLMSKVEEVERLAERVEDIEADPAAYGDSLYTKYPGTRPNFSF